MNSLLMTYTTSITTTNTINELRKSPQPIATSSPLAFVPSTVLIDAKSTLPRTQPIGGMMIASTSVVTTDPSATPTMTPIASARALVLVRNDLKSLIAAASVLDDLVEPLRFGDPAGDLRLRRDAPDDAGPRCDDFLEGDREIGGVAVGELRR